MKSAWTIVSVVAVANLLALGLLAAWLVTGDRLDRDRVERIRSMLSVTIADERAADETVRQETERARAEAELAEKMARPPIPASFIIESAQLARDSELQVDLRRQRELEDLRISLLRLQAGLEERETELAGRVEAFEEAKRRYASTEGAEQFRAALTTLEGQRPRDAKAVLHALLTIGQQEQVTAYLASMDEGARTKVIAEFVKDSPAVAADLLERLRTRGLGINRSTLSGVSSDGQPGSRTP
ncbi:MAG: hypothetical protein KF768_05975 [Phycisphaeraceae bacterium]|nr:hypothetical protein [Phycisphaeraceae bacterium]